MLNMQNVKDIEIQEGDVRTIHDKDNRLIWGRLAYDTKYAGDTLQNGTPTPDTPIPVQTVTGEQTVTISDGVDSEDFTISLGSIELCKIGDYQDYIYKSGDDWYVHKECSKYTFTGNETGQIYSPTSTYTEARFYGNYGEIGPTSNKATISTKFAYLNNNRVVVISGYNSNNWYVRIPSSFNVTTLEEMRTYVTNNTTYYPLATPTDTQITDSTLIGQLNAVHEWLTRYGYNATVTGNLPIIINKTNL
jgi:hypothetical protein